MNDNITATALNRLFALWKQHQATEKSAAEWDRLVLETRNVCAAAAGAADPELIAQFAAAVLCSLERIDQNTAASDILKK